MTGIDQLSRTINIIVYSIIAIGALGVGIYFILNKYGFLKKSKGEEVNYTNAEQKDTIEFVDFDDIKENMIITDDYSRFIAGVKTNGTEYYDGTNMEKARIITSYIEYINSISTLTKLYIQATEDDVSEFLTFFDELINKHKKQIDLLNKDVYQLNQSLQQIGSGDLEGRKLLEVSILDKKNKINNLNWMIERTEHKKYFINQTSSREERDKSESYIFVEYLKPSSFNDFTDEETVKKARTELDINIKSIVRGLAKSGVECTPLDGNDLGRILRSSYNPLDGDNVKFDDLLKSNMFSLVATGESVNELKMKALIELEESKKEGAEFAI